MKETPFGVFTEAINPCNCFARCWCAAPAVQVTLLAPRLSHPPAAPEPTGQAVLSWPAGEVISQGFEQLNEVLSFPSWEWEKARCCFLMLLFYFAAASPSRCLNVTDYFTAVRAWEGGAEGEVKNLASASQTAASPVPQRLHRHQGLEGMGGKVTFWEARVHRSVTHLPSSANTDPLSPHLFNPSALRLGMPCWLRKHKPQAAFWSLSAVLFCQAEAFLSSDTNCLLCFPLGIRARFLRSSPSLCHPLGAGQLAGLREPGTDTTLCTALQPTLACLHRAWQWQFGIPGCRRAVGSSGYQAAEGQRSPVRASRTSTATPWFHTAYRELLPTAGLRSSQAWTEALREITITKNKKQKDTA